MDINVERQEYPIIGTGYKTLSTIRDGSDNVISLELSNDIHVVPYIEVEPGVLQGNFTGCSTVVGLYVSNTLVTSGVTYQTIVDPDIVEYQWIKETREFKVLKLSDDCDSAQVVFKATYDGKVFENTFTITKIVNGRNSYYVDISNDSHLFSSDYEGYIDRDVTIETTVYAYRGNEQIEPTEIIFSETPAPGIKVEKRGVTLVITAMAGNQMPLAGGFEIKVKIGKETYAKTFRWIKTRDGRPGVDGSDGVSAKYVTVRGEQVFKYVDNFTGAPTPTKIVLEASAYGFDRPSYKWSYTKPGAASSTEIANAKENKLEVNYNDAYWLSEKQLTFRCTCDGRYDEITIVKISDGSHGGPQGESAYTVVITNESHPIVCDGTGKPLEGELGKEGKAKTKIIVYKGAELLQPVSQDTTVSKGQFRYSFGAHLNATAGRVSNDSAYIDTISDEEGSGYISLNILIENKQSVTKLMSFVKAIQGTEGPPGPPGPPGPAGPTLDWVQDWNGNRTEIYDSKIVTPRLFAGSNSGTPQSPRLTGVALGKDIFGTTGTYGNVSGLAMYRDGIKTLHFKTDGTVAIGKDGANQITIGTDGVLKVPAQLIAGQITANQINATNLKVDAANITGTLIADGIVGNSITASHIKGGHLEGTSVTTRTTGRHAKLTEDGLRFYSESSQCGSISYDSTGSGSSDEAKNRLWIRSLDGYALKIQSGGDMSIAPAYGKNIWVTGLRTLGTTTLEKLVVGGGANIDSMNVGGGNIAMTSAGGISCKGLTVNGTTNIGSLYGSSISLGNGNLQMSSSGGITCQGFTCKGGPIYGQNNLALARGTVYHPQGGGNLTTDYVRFNASIMSGVSSGNVHFITTNGANANIYAGNVRSSYTIEENILKRKTGISALEEIEKAKVVNTLRGYRLKQEDEVVNSLEDKSYCIKTVYNEQTKREEVSVDITSTISILWKAIQELKETIDNLSRQ